MPVQSNDEFVDVVRRSGIVDEERLSRFLSGASVPEGEMTALAEALIREGLLTPWQCERLLDGKWKGFFLGKYKILHPLGAGAMGSVFLAEHKVMRHRVAIKVLARRLISKPTNVARFQREARAAAVINHPNVVRAFDIDQDGENHYLVMEYVEGENLQRLVQLNGPMEPKVAADYVCQIARGLNEAHRNQLVHRDIKPANLLLDRTGLVKVLDLGLARMIDDDVASLTIANDSKLIGTVDYLSPEQARNSHDIDGRADIYSLGCTLYFLLTGSQPFPTGTLTERIIKHQTMRPVDMRKRRPGVPEALVVIVSRMMEKVPARRYATCADVADALTEFIEDRFQIDAPQSHVAAKNSGEDSSIDYDLDASPSSASGSSPASGRSSRGSGGGDFALAETSAPHRSEETRRVENNRPHGQSARAAAARVAVSAAANVSAETSIFDEILNSPASPSSSTSSVFDSLPAAETLLPGGTTAVGSKSRSIVESRPSAATNALLERARQEQNAERNDSGFNYPLWFLVISGAILGFILVGVGFSYLKSFGEKEKPAKVEKNGGFERD